MRIRQSTLSIILLLICTELKHSIGFSTSPSRTRRSVSKISFGIDIDRRIASVALWNSADPVAAEEAQGAATIEDKNGKMIAVGSIIRVAVENLKAYQVPGKGQGSFNENKEFVPATKGGARSSKNLVLPVGLRGVVTKVYYSDDVSANFPIQVKFSPGQNNDEGYDSPVPFLMHFCSEEVEGV